MKKTLRPLDILYLVFFLTHIPIALFVDLVPLYPTHLAPSLALKLNAWYTLHWKDAFMTIPNEFWWFKSISYCEASLQLPFFFYACWSIYHDRKHPLPFLVYTTHVLTTVIPILSEFALAPTLLLSEKIKLLVLYSPYAIVPFLLFCDVIQAYI
ncbi:hypothetical protein BZG36_00055 [Bifiguratus adelaidae]|uniref:EXPERA domain-containing protein n=1 Tax=Bifiguratus adelaidae TaxID=1938954 RepID=A0A261Y8S5_9FUNG|nr:hypothetical protein BZG36_00055 [Bifiguratus adelaidae]